MLKIDILTLFPKITNAYAEESIIKRAQEKKLVRITAYDIRDFATDKHRKVDDRPYGGGAGMVLRASPIMRTVESITRRKKNSKQKVIILSAKGKQFNQKTAYDWSREQKHLILVSGRYEGIDERVKKILKAEEISMGPYVLTDGDLGALAITSSVVRLLPGVLGNTESLSEESFSKIHNNTTLRLYGSTVLTEYPHYTRPEILKYRGKIYRVPKVLLSGDHKKIQAWRLNQSKNWLKLAKKNKK